MRHKIVFTSRCVLRNGAGDAVTDPRFLKKVSGMACVDDTALNYLDGPEDTDRFRGGFPRLDYDADKKRLRIAVEIDSPRKLKRDELTNLREGLTGQITDGIGSGCFDELAAETGLSIDSCPADVSMAVKCVQESGNAWKPRASAAAGNARKITALLKLVQKEEAKDEKREQKTATKPQRVLKRQSAAKPKGSAGPAPAAVPAGKRPNFKKLFRILHKYDSQFRFDEIKAELERIGSDLSQVADGEFPYTNFKNTKIAKLLLDSGLNVHLFDRDGHSLIYLAAVSLPCLKHFVKRGADVNCRNKSYGDETPLMRAASLDCLKGVEFLLASGADPKLKDRHGDTALKHVDDNCRNTAKLRALLK